MKYFTDVLPEACVVFTSLPNADFEEGADANWVSDCIKIAMVSFLELEPESKEFDSFVKRWNAHKFRRLVVSDINQTHIISGKIVEQAPLSLSIFNLREEDYHLLPIAMKDPLGKTDLVSFCFYFRKSALIAGIKKTYSKKWWQFWR